MANEIDRALTFMKAIGADPHEFHRVQMHSSHEALVLEYEHAMTRIDSRTEQPYDVSGHFVWIGERTRQLDGAHVELLSRIRAFAPEVPALFLSAKDAVQDRITGLAAGGDDYVTKPFSMEEVLLRLHRLVQRSGVAAMDTAELVVGDLVLNVDTREVSRAGEELHLTATQFELLRYLMENPKRVISKAQILDRVWDYDFGGQANIVELYISYLRKKVDANHAPMIHTVRGAGYVLKPAD